MAWLGADFMLCCWVFVPAVQLCWQQGWPEQGCKQGRTRQGKYCDHGKGNAPAIARAAGIDRVLQTCLLTAVLSSLKAQCKYDSCILNMVCVWQLGTILVCDGCTLCVARAETTFFVLPAQAVPAGTIRAEKKIKVAINGA